MPERRPNVLFFHVDNLGFGELSCYSGGPFRGCMTERIDAFAAGGIPVNELLPGISVHPHPLGAADGPSCHPLGHS